MIRSRYWSTSQPEHSDTRAETLSGILDPVLYNQPVNASLTKGKELVIRAEH